MKIKLYFLLIIIAFFSELYAQSKQGTFYIRLQFSDVDTPPSSFITYKKLKRPKIGLALSGGGARGFAQIGVLKVLEENNVPIDFIVGVSMGSIVGGLYAAGYNAAEIEEFARNIEWQNIMSDKPPRTSLFVGQKEERSNVFLQVRFKGKKIDLPKAITPGQRLISLLTNLTIGADFQSGANFDRLRIPFRAVACDLLTGKKVLLSSGNLAIAMKASSAIPLLFEPVSWNGALLADGGLVNNIPVEELKQFKVDLIIAIDTTSELNEKSELSVPWKIADQVTTIMQQEKNRAQRQAADVLIRPDLENLKSDNFQNVDELIAAGEKAARAKIKELKYLLDKKQVVSVEQKNYSAIIIDDFGVPSDLISNLDSTIQTGNLRNTGQVYELLKSIYETGYFQDVFAVCTEKTDTLYVEIKAKENPAFKYIKFLNNQIFTDSLLSTIINSERNKPINYYHAKRDLKNLATFYRKNGYSFMTVSDVSLEHDTLNISIDEGRIAKINVRGNHITKDFVILREFPLKPKNIFNINKVRQGLENIYSTNLFKTVMIEVQKNNQNQAILNINIEEKAFSVLSFSFRYNLERKNKLLFELRQENFLGFGNPLSLETECGSRDKFLSLNYRSDRILNTFLTNSAQVYWQQRDYYTYDVGKKIGEYRLEESGLSFSIGQQIERLGIFSLIASAKKVNIASLAGSGYATGVYDIKNIELRSIVDTQDKYPFPSNGKYYLFEYKLSSATILNSEISYFKFLSSLDFYRTVRKRNTFHLKTFWGTSDLSAPFFEFFNLGGRNSFIGLHENELLGRHVLQCSGEYRYRFPFGFPLDFYLSLRYDFGATWKKYVEDIKSQDFFHGYGIILAADTPAGPIYLGIGKASRRNPVIYFNAGFEF